MAKHDRLAKVSQSGLRVSKMVSNDQYNMFLTILALFTPFWTFLDENQFFAKKHKVLLGQSARSKKSSFVLVLARAVFFIDAYG